MVAIRHERPTEAAAREALLDLAYGPARFAKPSTSLREGRPPALALVAAERRRIIGTVRLWPVLAGASRPALLLGSLAVHPGYRLRGIGAELVRRALREARALGRGAVLLVGDASYYARFGFSSAGTGGLWLPGSYEQHRLLGLELVEGALDGARGMIRAASPAARQPVRTTSAVASLLCDGNPLAPRAA
jgi:predicted N-acetyltransferase YhbS